MMRVYRIAKAKYASSAGEMLSGRAGYLAGARWHSKGRAIVYTATSLSLATLEIAVNLKQPRYIPAYRMLEVEVPDSEVIQLAPENLPAGWDIKNDVPRLARAIGDRWLKERVSLAMRVPSAVIESEWNVLLNPLHAEFARLEYGEPMAFPFDPRIKE